MFGSTTDPVILITIVIAALLLSTNFWWEFTAALWGSLVRFLAGPPGITLLELRGLLPEDQNITVHWILTKGSGPDIFVRLEPTGHGHASVLYHQINRIGVERSERITVRASGRTGVVLTLRNNTVVECQYIGKRSVENPVVTSREQACVNKMIRRIREIVDAADGELQRPREILP